MAPDTRGFRRLDVWRLSFGLAREVYRSTECFPKSEQFGLTSQVQRAALSVPSNIAEGFGRGQHTRDFARFLRMARGSLCEVETCLLLAKELGYLPQESFLRLEGMSAEASRTISGLIRSVEHGLEGKGSEVGESVRL